MTCKIMSLRRTIAALCVATMFCSCGGGNKKSAADTERDSLSTEFLSVERTRLDSLTVGEFAMKDDAFGETVELIGTPIDVDDIFKVSSTEAICIDTLLIMYNMKRADDRFLSVYSLPSLSFIKSLGTFGRGPGEFGMPQLVPVSDDPDALCYVRDVFSHQISALTPELTLEPFVSELPEEYRKYTSEKMYTARNRNEMIFSHANAIMRWCADSLGLENVTNLYNLSLHRINPGVGYIGALGVNYEQRRFAYAYKFVKRIVFGDFDGRVRTLQWGKATKDIKEGSAGVIAPIDSNTTHYWKIYTTAKHVYVSYSGRTPFEVVEDNKRPENRHIFMEVFDWNGNPVKRYRLDEWGFFTVDEERNTLYLLCTENAISFRAYKLQ